MNEIATKIEARFSELGVKVQPSEIETRLDQLINKYKVPPEEARRNVINYFLKQHNIPKTEFFAPKETTTVKVSEIKEDGKWVTLRVKVVQLWDSNQEAISQAGLIGDESGTIKFTKWKKAALPSIEEGKNYLFKNVTTSEWQGQFSIKLNRTSEIIPIKEEINIEMPQVKASDIKEDGKWVTLRAKVVQLWETNHESVSQVGLLGDESGTIKFTKWKKANLPQVEEGKSYLFKNVTTSEWQGQFSIKLNKTSAIEPIKEDIEVGSTLTEYRGAIVDIQSGSGLIKRCPECNRALVKGACGEHGKVEGIYDLRVKAVMDDGEKVQDILLNREVTEALIGITIQKAKEMATEALDQSVVLDLIKSKLIGRYFIVSGKRLDRFILVDTISQDVNPMDEDIKKLLATAAQQVAQEA
ncbi:replication protein A [Candidatus Methanoperedens nitratireducens]|uniref:Single-stranded DNA-binding protein n=1 Tax=Candidatus Methanoperedens nitratireducens TaxID=1392998 RepID=A0A284VQE8_9EURY|nr:replication protein A [Candidatus Methanoperedens nitroreducens]SNQ61520.1 Single-stranded DNA-binding protein [Candidatus Methanoperedens nitroreducens]